MDPMDKDSTGTLQGLLLELMALTTLVKISQAAAVEAAQRGEPEGKLPHIEEVYKRLLECVRALSGLRPVGNPEVVGVIESLDATKNETAGLVVARALHVEDGEGLMLELSGAGCGQDNLEEALAGLLLRELGSQGLVSPDLVATAVAGWLASPMDLLAEMSRDAAAASWPSQAPN